MKQPLIAISWGEFFDRLSICRLKASKLPDKAARAVARQEVRELSLLAHGLKRPPGLPKLLNDLHLCNARLWALEERVRENIRQGSLGKPYVASARAITLGNNRRSSIKAKINSLLPTKRGELKSWSSASK